MRNVWLGWDPKETVAHAVAAYSIKRHATVPDLHVRRLASSTLGGLYQRPTERRDGQLYDLRSEAPMTTEHAIARFFVPYLQDYRRWAIFCDGDVLCRADIAELFACADDRYAVQVVQHPPQRGTALKKAGMPQVLYPRKNQSSVMLLNCGHPSNEKLTLNVLNTWPGRDLHAFKWLEDYEVGSLPPRWNYLVNVSHPIPDPAIVHYTLGTPDIDGHANDPFADEWFAIAETVCGSAAPL